MNLNQRLLVSLEVEKDGFTYILYIPVGAKFADAYEATVAFGEKINEMGMAALEKAQGEQKKEEDLNADGD